VSLLRYPAASRLNSRFRRNNWLLLHLLYFAEEAFHLCCHRRLQILALVEESLAKTAPRYGHAVPLRFHGPVIGSKACVIRQVCLIEGKFPVFEHFRLRHMVHLRRGLQTEPFPVFTVAIDSPGPFIVGIGELVRHLIHFINRIRWRRNADWGQDP